MSTPMLAPEANMKMFALEYLESWYEYDQGFVEGLASENKEKRLRALADAAYYYKVSRNFKTGKEEVRLNAALSCLDKVVVSVKTDNVDEKVCELAEAFRSAYGQYAESAASKFLWVSLKSPIVIYDGRAWKYLNRRREGRPSLKTYGDFRREWRRQFSSLREKIITACSELPRVRDFTLAYSQPDKDFQTIIASPWFHERVFDKFLWFYGGADMQAEALS